MVDPIPTNVTDGMFRIDLAMAEAPDGSTPPTEPGGTKGLRELGVVQVLGPVPVWVLDVTAPSGIGGHEALRFLFTSLGEAVVIGQEPRWSSRVLQVLMARGLQSDCRAGGDDARNLWQSISEVWVCESAGGVAYFEVVAARGTFHSGDSGVIGSASARRLQVWPAQGAPSTTH